MSSFFKKVFSDEEGLTTERAVFGFVILLVLTPLVVMVGMKMPNRTAAESGSGSTSSGAAGGAAWLTDYKAAQSQTEKDGKLLFMDFTGSDWCGWCIKLDREVFDTDEFRGYAAKNLVLLKVDFPKRKSQSDGEKRQNADLARRFGIRGYPTIVVLNSKGRMLGQLGYMPGGPKAFLSELESLRKQAG